ncbi:hypothetical protein GUJ93_ZPchr0001g31828 [Zizania palustris]|uniref:Uncharacterized protein n=1 Tax=Zizania palustris TaxID=103762 RepID=A0A8J5VCW6_ZIZPA|nr:hypothetical protein GUJ93_ZPchr0001g31828 [Zizania palustris]
MKSLNRSFKAQMSIYFPPKETDIFMGWLEHCIQLIIFNTRLLPDILDEVSISSLPWISRKPSVIFMCRHFKNGYVDCREPVTSTIITSYPILCCFVFDV